ncbi:techylectin-5A [Nephila pilipes]|uniref:Techylectin-5A n=1 Tax=Nephila pilipes TaxID=299642 RepID=A0A8X6KB78_NEPPI|nr:techylectin-5A [Nephila pilipes]
MIVKTVAYIGIFLLVLSFSRGSENQTIPCNYAETSFTYLDVAMEMITRARRNFPKCRTTFRYKDLKPIDCEELLRNGHNMSGVYTVWPKSRVMEDKPVNVFCDMDTAEGGWTVIQRRGNYGRSKDYFFKDWDSYKTGFGDIEKDFWLGNDNIFALTNQRLYSIRFDLKAVGGTKRYALYDAFWIDDEAHKYTLHIKDYSGDAGDSMSGVHDNYKFSTKDQDNDIHMEENCAKINRGGWWYSRCHHANLNGAYLRGPHETSSEGVNWKTFKGFEESLDTTEMKIRPKNFGQRGI